MPSDRVKDTEATSLNEATFPERAYLSAFPDIDAAIKAGIFKSAYDHFIKEGRREIASGQRRGFSLAAYERPAAASPAAGEATDGLSDPTAMPHIDPRDLTCFVDEIRDGIVSGWVLNQGSGVPRLHAVIDKQEIINFNCDDPRPDVAAQFAGRLYVGFEFTIPRRLLNGRERRLEFRVEPNLPVELVFRERRSYFANFSHVWKRRLVSNVDGLSNGYIMGWVLSERDEEGGLQGGAQVVVSLHGAKIAQLRANIYRPDVARELGADPYCGFEFSPPAQYRTTGSQTFSFAAAPSNVELEGSPCTVTFISSNNEAVLIRLNEMLDQLFTDITVLRRDVNKLLPASTYTIGDYNHWAPIYFSALRAATAQRVKHDANLPSKGKKSPKALVSIVCPTYKPKLADFAEAVASVIAQTYTDWELIIVDDGSADKALTAYLATLPAKDSRIKVKALAKNGGISAATNAGIDAATGTWIAFLDHDDLLVDVAVDIMIDAAKKTDAVVLYSDEDKIDQGGNMSAPAFKPDWNHRLLLGVNYVCHFLMVQREIVKKVGKFNPAFDGAQDHDFILRISEAVPAAKIHHVPEVLYQWRITENSTALDVSSKPYAVTAGINCVSEHVKRLGKRAIVKNIMESTLYRINWQNLGSPKVHIVIPFKNQIETTKRCLDRIIELTQYSNFRVTLVDNWSTSEDLPDFIREAEDIENVEILRVEESFNYSRLNNLAVANSDADMFVFMNNDLFVKDRMWLRTLVNEALADDKVAVVGGKFLYPNGSIQHAGVVLGIGGVAGHAHTGLRENDGGYAGRAFFAQEVSAVTAACLLVKAAPFRQVGGFDEVELQVAFNDIDLCLKLGAAGYKIIWTPEFVADHHESLSRGSDERPETRARFFHETQTMKERWGDHLKNDPFYSKHFDLDARPFFDLVRPDRLSRAQK